MKRNNLASGFMALTLFALLAGSLPSTIAVAEEAPEAAPRSENVPSEHTLSGTFTNKIRTPFMGITKPEKLDEFLNTLSDEYKTYKDADAKLYALNAVLLRDSKSIVWKLRKLASESRFTHSVLIMAVQMAAGAQSVILPTSQWDAGYRYVSEPFSASDQQFQTVEEVQAYLGVVYDHVKTAYDQLAALNVSRPITIDLQMFIGPVKFQSAIADRYVFFGEAERQALLSLYAASLHNIAVFRAYNLPDYFQVVGEFGRKIGVDGISPGENGFPAKERAKLLRGFRSSFKNTAEGHNLMNAALEHLRDSVKHARGAWDKLKVRPASQFTIFDSAIVQAFQINRGSDLALRNLEDMVKGPSEIASTISSNKVVVNLPEFYAHPVENLTDLLPKTFQGENEDEEIYRFGRHHPPFRNYKKGSPATWDTAAWKKFFPNLKEGEDLRPSIRLLYQSWGGSLTTLPALFLVI